MKMLFLVAATVALPTLTMAQSKIECVLAADGQYQAALIWQNTLGVERANSICRMNAPAPVQVVVPATQAPEASAAAVGSRFDPSVYQKAAQRNERPASVGRVSARLEPQTKQHRTGDEGSASQSVPSEYVQMW